MRKVEKMVSTVICPKMPTITELTSDVYVHYLERHSLGDILEFHRERDRVPDGITYKPVDGTGWEYADSEVLYVARWWEVSW